MDLILHADGLMIATHNSTKYKGYEWIKTHQSKYKNLGTFWVMKWKHVVAVQPGDKLPGYRELETFRRRIGMGFGPIFLDKPQYPVKFVLFPASNEFQTMQRVRLLASLLDLAQSNNFWKLEICMEITLHGHPILSVCTNSLNVKSGHITMACPNVVEETVKCERTVQQPPPVEPDQVAVEAQGRFRQIFDQNNGPQALQWAPELVQEPDFAYMERMIEEHNLSDQLIEYERQQALQDEYSDAPMLHDNFEYTNTIIPCIPETGDLWQCA